MLAEGHRRMWREAALMAASTAPSLEKPGRSCRLPQQLFLMLAQVNGDRTRRDMRQG